MSTITFTPNGASQSVDWNDPSIWSGGVVPNSLSADVVFPTVTTISTGQIYHSTITIDPSDNFSENSVSLTNNTLFIVGTLSVTNAFNIQQGGEIDMRGTLSVGSLDNNGLDIQGFGQINSIGLLTNNSLIGGDLTITTYGLTNTGELVASDTSMTVNVGAGGFSNLSSGVLTGGFYDAGFVGASPPSVLFLNVGGVLVSDAANITLTGGGDIQFFNPNGSSYESIQSTLQSIAAAGTLTLNSYNYTGSSLTVDGSLVLTGATTLIEGHLGLDAGGEISGVGTIVGPIVNAATIVAGEAVNTGAYLLDLDGAVTGAGVLEIAAGMPAFSGHGTGSPGAMSTLELGGPTAETVEFSNNIGTLQLDHAATFTGKIDPVGVGDQIVLSGASLSSLTGFSYSGGPTSGVLTVHDGGAPITLNFNGDYSAASFSFAAGPQLLSSSPPSLMITVGQSLTTTLDDAFTNVMRTSPTSTLATTPTIALGNGSTVTNPVYTDAQTLPSLAPQVDASTITTAQALNTIGHYGDSTASVATIAYEFFTGATPNSSGYDYLITSASNPDNLDSPYYARFNEENRFINFAVNLGGAGGAGTQNFQNNYGSLDLADALTKAYTAIFGFTPVTGESQALLSATVAPGETRADYFASYGGDGPTGLGTKAAAVGWLMVEAVKADLGVYAAANDQFVDALAGGTGHYNVDLLSSYSAMSAGAAAAIETQVTTPTWGGIASITNALSVADTATDVLANIGPLEALAEGSKLTSITLTDAFTPTLSLTANQYATDSHVLSILSGAYAVSLTGTTAQFNNETILHFDTAGSILDMTDLSPGLLNATFAENAGGTSGQLIVSDGAHSAAVTLVGQLAAPNFSGSAASAGFVFGSDGIAGTDITYRH